MAVPFGRYELLKKIASGGMGQVFLARTATHGFDKLVVIKRILPHLVEDDEFITMFFDEAGIAARLNHPNLVQIFERGEAKGSHYLAMEYVAGEDLRRLDRFARKQARPLPLGVACRIIADAAAGLDYAHTARDAHGNPLNLVHRDVSPQNILVGFDGGVKLIDFGVARAVGRAQHTATGILKGKYPYMSPEQMAGFDYDHRSDQFALGIVFWEILTGRRLFKGDSDLVTMRLVRECNVPAPSAINPDLPRALDGLVLRALAAEPKDRYPDTGAFRMAIEEFALSHRLPASSAHVSATMRTLYAERIEREADISALDELTASSAFEDSAPSQSSAGSRLPARAAPHRSSTQGAAAIEGTQPLMRSGASSRVRTFALLGAAALVLVASAVIVPRFLPTQPVEPAPTLQPIVERAPDPIPVEPETAPSPTTAEPIRIQLTSSPSGAEISVRDVVMGRTPLEYALSPGDSVDAVLTLPGHEPQRITLSEQTAPSLEVTFKRKPAKRPTRNSDDTSTLGIKTGR